MEQLNNQGRTIRFKIVERRGVTLEEKLRKSNPWAGERCGRDNCFPCQTDESGDCWREGVSYPLVCEQCGVFWREWAKWFHEGRRAPVEQGGSGREQICTKAPCKSPPWRSRCEVRFIMKVTGMHNDSIDRWVTEGVNIANFGGDVLMNRRGELGGVRIERQQYRRWGAN